MMADTNINIKPSIIITGLCTVAFVVLSWSLSVVYDNLIDKINTIETKVDDKIKENREKIKVQWALIREKGEEIDNIEKELLRHRH